MKEAWKAGRNGSSNGNSKRNKTTSFAPRKEELNAMCEAAAAKAVKSALKRSKDESEDEAEAEERKSSTTRRNWVLGRGVMLHLTSRTTSLTNRIRRRSLGNP